MAICPEYFLFWISINLYNTAHVQILLWELARTLHLRGGSIRLGSFGSTLLFGLPPLVGNFISPSFQI